MNKMTTVVTIALLLNAFGPLKADDIWPAEPFEASAESVFAAAKDVALESDGDSAMVFLEEVVYKFDDEARQTKIRTLVYTILNEAGVDNWDTVSANWERWHQRRPTIEARVLTPDGKIVYLDPETVSEAPNSYGGDDVFDDGRTLEAPLPHSQIGCIVETRVTVAETQPRFPGGATSRFYPGWSVPAHHVRLIVEIPHAKTLKWKAKLLENLEPVVESRPELTRYIFEFPRPKEEAEIESNLPFDHPRRPHIAFSTGSRWSEIARAYAREVEGKIAAAGDLVLPIPPPEPDDTRSAIIQELLNRLHEKVRYTGLEFGRSAIIPYAPDVVLARGYGDCKDQATLLVAWLRLAGIEANVALLKSGFGRDTDPDLPSLGAFNHVVVHISGPSEMWIDPTSTYHRAGEIPPADAGRRALVAAEGTESLVEIPNLQARDSGVREERVFELADEGKSRLTVTIKPWGAKEVSYRNWCVSKNKSELLEAVSDWVAPRFLAEEVSDTHSSDPADLNESFTLQYTIDEAGRGQTGLGDAMVAILYEELLGHFPGSLTEETDEPRQNDFIFRFPFSVAWSYRVVPPSGFVGAHLPEDRHTVLGTARLEEKFVLTEDGSIEATIRLDSGPRRITASEFDRTRKALLELKDHDYTPLYFVHQGNSLLSEGRTAEGLAELWRLSRLEPGNALHQTRLAQGLIAVGLGDEARKAARRAVEIDPQSLTAHKILGWILQHDLVGRHFGPGFDLEGALASYRNAKGLEDSDLNTMLNLAILLEHNAEGRRYAPDADLRGAVDEYQKAREDFPTDFKYDHNLLVALLWDRRYEDIVDLRPELGPSDNENIIIATAVAAIQGVEEAVALIQRRYREKDKIRSKMTEVGQLMGQQRLYTEADKFMRAAAQGAPNATEILSNAFVMKRTRRIEDLKFDPKTPVGVVKQAYVFAGSADGDQRIRGELLADLIRDRYDDDDLAAAGLNLSTVMRETSMELNLPQAVLADLTIGGIEWITEGGKSPVRRVQLRSIAGEGQNDSVMFVLKEGDEFKLLATEEDISSLGMVALEMLSNDDLDSVYEILNWARDLVYSYDSGDPLARNPFAEIWNRSTDAPATLARAAALCLAAIGPFNETIQAEISEMIAKTDDVEVATLLRLSLLGIALELEQTDQMEEGARLLSKRFPNSWVPLMFRSAALAEDERHDQAIAIIEEFLERHPGDIVATRLLSSAEQLKGNVDRAIDLLTIVVNSSEAVGNDHNNLAWLAMFQPEIDERAIMRANAAVNRATSQDEEAAALHTLAAIYAQNDMPREAYQTIVDAMDQHQEPRPHDWFVFGRIAESYGLPDAARTAYQRVIDEDDDDSPVSTSALAQRRLASLASEAEHGQAASAGRLGDHHPKQVGGTGASGVR